MTFNVAEVQQWCELARREGLVGYANAMRQAIAEIDKRDEEIERLRRMLRLTKSDSKHDPDLRDAQPWDDWACDEIERLRTEVQTTRNGFEAVWKQLALVERQRDKAVALLRDALWHQKHNDKGDEWSVCGVCYEDREHGHASDCGAAKLLAQIGGE